MVYKLLAHSWLSFWRSKTLSRSLATTIFTWFMMVLIMLYALGLGVMLAKIIANISPEKDPIVVLNGWLVFYWMSELLFRIIFQRNVTINIQYYLTQRVKSNDLANFMLLKSWVNLFLLVTVLVFAPFAFGKIVSTHGLATGWTWFGFLFAVSFLLHHFVVAIHQITKGRSLPPLVLGASILLMGYLNIVGYVDFTFITDGLMALVLVNPLLILVPILFSVALYYYDIKLIIGNLYLDYLPENIKVASGGVSRWVSYLNSYGTVGQLIALELRLIWRNKRPRTMMITGFFLILYFFYFLSRLSDTPMFEAIMLLGTGAFMINYGQLLFSWESSYFDYLMTRNFSSRKYLLSKFILLLGLNTFALILVGLIIAFIDFSLLKGLITWYLINSGFFIYIFIGGTMLGPKKLDVNARAMFNYEGMNAFQFLVIIPYVLVPLGAMYLLETYLGDNWRDIILIVLGLMGITFHQNIIRFLSKKFVKRKYKILHGFRE